MYESKNIDGSVSSICQSNEVFRGETKHTYEKVFEIGDYCYLEKSIKLLLCIQVRFTKDGDKLETLS